MIMSARDARGPKEHERTWRSAVRQNSEPEGETVAQRIVVVEAKARFAGIVGAAADFDDHRLAAVDRRGLAHDLATEQRAGAALEAAFLAAAHIAPRRQE